MLMVPPSGAAARSANAHIDASGAMEDPLRAMNIATQEAFPHFNRGTAVAPSVLHPAYGRHLVPNSYCGVISPPKLLAAPPAGDRAFSGTSTWNARIELDASALELADGWD